MFEIFYYKILGKISFLLKENCIKLLQGDSTDFNVCKKKGGALIKVQILSPYSVGDSELVRSEVGLGHTQGILMMLVHGRHMKNPGLACTVDVFKEEEEMVILKTKKNYQGRGW